MRLIDADNLTELCDIMADKCEGIGEGVWRQFRVTVEWCPTIDAVPVLRCKDCVYFERDDGEGVDDWCSGTGAGISEDGYCSYGERRP